MAVLFLQCELYIQNVVHDVVLTRLQHLHFLMDDPDLFLYMDIFLKIHLDQNAMQSHDAVLQVKQDVPEKKKQVLNCDNP